MRPLLDLTVYLFLVSSMIQGSYSMGMDDNMEEDLEENESEVTPDVHPDHESITYSHQSPVALETSNAIFRDCPPLVFEGHWHLSRCIIENNGKTAEIGEPTGAGSHAMLYGGPLKDKKYRFVQAHFHWGNDSHWGSEHMVNGHRYTMEVHFVHHDAMYSSVKEARAHKGAIVVVAFFLKVVSEGRFKQNKRFNLVVHHLPVIRTKLGKQRAESNILTCFKKLATPDNYFYYDGSLTTDPYTEGVNWIVYPQYAYITEPQVEKFRRLWGLNGTTITANWRKLQPMNGRPVHFCQMSWDDYDDDEEYYYHK